jgi:Outer membrane protein beta-barrel domain
MNQLPSIVLSIIIVFCFQKWSYSSEYYLGVNSGLVTSSVANKNDYNLFRSAFAGYGTFEIKPYNSLSFQFQIGYAMKGFQTKFSVNKNDSAGNPTLEMQNINGVNKFNYVEAPILSKFIFCKTSPINFTIDIGSYISYLVFAKVDRYTDGDLTMSNRNIINDFNLIDIGSIWGAGLEKHLGPGKITFDIRFSIGFLEIYKKPHGNYYNYLEYTKTFNTSYYFLLGYEIDIM